MGVTISSDYIVGPKVESDDNTTFFGNGSILVPEIGDLFIELDETAAPPPSAPLPGEEIGYAETNSTWTNVSGTSNVAQQVSPLSFTAGVTSLPCYVEIGTILQLGTAGPQQIFIAIQEDGVQVAEWQITLMTQFALVPVSFKRRLTPPVGDRLYTAWVRTSVVSQTVSLLPSAAVTFMRLVNA